MDLAHKWAELVRQLPGTPVTTWDDDYSVLGSFLLQSIVAMDLIDLMRQQSPADDQELKDLLSSVNEVMREAVND